jgi:voltage-gated potassium channel
MRSAERLRRIEEATDLPLLILALVMVPLLLAPFFFDPSPTVETTLLAGDWMIWSVFFVDFAVKLAVAPRRLHYVRTHWLEAAMVALPFLRPLRAARLLRLLRLARVGVALGLNVSLLRRLAAQRGAQLLVASVLMTGVVGAFLVLLSERHAEGSNIQNFGDAMWWAATTMTTVGYGDRFPVTPAGRGVAVALMLFGIASLSAVTAIIAAFLVREQVGAEEVTMSELRDEIRQLRADLLALNSGALRNQP